MKQRNFKKPFEFQNFSEIFYCGMTRLKNTNFVVFARCQYTRTILRNKNMEQSLFKKHSKFQNCDEIFYCGMTQEHEFGCCYAMSVQKNYSKKEKYGTQSD